MCNLMFGNENYGSYVDHDSRLIMVSMSKNGTVEYCPSTGVTSYQRRYQ